MKDGTLFVYKGFVIATTDTAETLNMSDGDVINIRPQ